MITVHIGLGKCASTSLQRYVFPELEKINKNIEYNNKKLVFLAKKHHFAPLNSKERNEFDKIIKNGKDHLISQEALVNGDPVLLEEAADLNLKLFEKEANIIIIVRDSMSYFTSVYQQRVQEGNVISASDFFVCSDVYDKTKLFYYQKFKARVFNAEEFSLKKIYDIYNERFNSVFFVPLSKVNDLLFIKNIYNLTDDEMEVLKSNFINAPNTNKAYSLLAMKLTFKRERFLSLFGLKSQGSWDVSPLKNIVVNDDNNMVLFSNLSLIDKVKQLPIRIRNRFKWRSFMQNNINKYFPYRKYELPKGLPIPQENLKQDSIFLKKIEKDYDDFKKNQHKEVYKFTSVE